ncbi:hypothetical protein K443DRAFT_685465 [Laccaria amethystina LaAM-08-1]|uniref:Uncharacterized protein n=1 Tax=Laccaria amethystina LaAM-08-1 TaxID=1095629 RepID=A0A0C9X368_9AGAR|nr:hypothetical protein K443DRAFT_685465 [Laccaria amethystina LaAM-08-1]
MILLLKVPLLLIPRKAYKWLLKWAAAESLQIHTQSKIHTHCLVINLLAVERVVGPIPSPFIIIDAHVSETKTVLPDARTSENDTRTSERIREEGGVGQAMVVLQCHMVNGQVVCMVERFEIWERKEGVYEHFGGWEGVLKGVANGTIGLADISCQLELGELDGLMAAIQL